MPDFRLTGGDLKDGFAELFEIWIRRRYNTSFTRKGISILAKCRNDMNFMIFNVAALLVFAFAGILVPTFALYLLAIFVWLSLYILDYGYFYILNSRSDRFFSFMGVKNAFRLSVLITALYVTGTVRLTVGFRFDSGANAKLTLAVVGAALFAGVLTAVLFLISEIIMLKRKEPEDIIATESGNRFIHVFNGEKCIGSYAIGEHFPLMEDDLLTIYDKRLFQEEAVIYSLEESENYETATAVVIGERKYALSDLSPST